MSQTTETDLGKGQDINERNIEPQQVKKKVLHEVSHVYLHIPDDLSATKFELPVEGVAELLQKGKDYFLAWNPTDITHNDVACLYASETDAWTMVDNVINIEESAEIIEDRPHYKATNLDAPDPILQTTVTSEQSKSSATAAVAVQKASVEKTSSKPILKMKYEPFLFSLSQLHSIREHKPTGQGYPHLSFYLKDGKSMPMLYFHDGGITTFLKAMSPRYVYLLRSIKDPTLITVEDFTKYNAVSSKSHTGIIASLSEYPGHEIKQDVRNAVVGAGSKFAGFFRKTFLSEKHLINTPRPTVTLDTEEEEQSEEASENHKTGVKLSELEFSVFGDYAVVPSAEPLPPRPSTIKRQQPISREEWESFRDQSGRISGANQEQFLSRVFYGGISADIRAETWKYLLDYMPFDKTDSERMILRREKEEEYHSMKKQWKSFSEVQLKRFRLLREHRHLINKDVYRTDREIDKYKGSNSHSLTQLEDILTTYVMYNVDLGYVQGMSDMLAPILYVMDNEVDAFWCFAGLMERTMRYFELTQEHTKARIKKLRTLVMLVCPTLYDFLVHHNADNLYFCFRWLLVSFKREFNYEGVMRIWEVIWTNRLSTDYAIFMALAILDKESDKICHPDNDFSDILKYINELAFTMDVDEVLELAECHVHQLARYKKLPDEIKSIINDPLPGRQVVPWQHNHTSRGVLLSEVSEDVN